MKYARAEIGGLSVIVSAMDRSIPPQEPGAWLFHCQPQLYLPEFATRLDAMDVQLEINCPQLGISILSPDGKILVRRPYPNPAYFVAGTAQRKMGWLMALPEGLDQLDLSIDWLLPISSTISKKLKTSRVRHELTLCLRPGTAGRVYSMYQRYWVARSTTRPQMVVTAEDARALARNAPGEINEFSSTGGYCGIQAEIIFRQTLVLHPSRLAELGLDEFERTRSLEDAKPVTRFTLHTQKHRANACCEVPPAVLHQAILLARSIPYGRSTPFWNSWEAHPAMRMLCEWWNAHAPNSAYRLAAHAMPWVRVEDDDQYWCGYYEHANVELTAEEWPSASMARWDDFVVVQFAKSRAVAYLDYEGDCICQSVDGGLFDIVSDRLESYHPAWYGMEALRQFPKRFPAAWKRLRHQALTSPDVAAFSLNG